MRNIERRTFLKTALMAGAGSMVLNDTLARALDEAETTKEQPTCNPGSAKKVIIGGGGISGLCCAYELMKAGHEVIVLEASGRFGGSVLTVHDGLSDGLYADFGAENFTKPGYKNYWKYVDEFKLTALPYLHRKDRLTRIDGKWYTEEQQMETLALKAKELGGFNKREVKYLSSTSSSNIESKLQSLYLQPFFEKFKDEYQPFGIGLDPLEKVSMQDIYKKEGASAAALNLLGGTDSSALYAIWQAYIMRKREYDMDYELYRLKGGNQVLTNEFGKRLGTRVKLDCQIQEVEHGQSGVTIKYREFGEEKTISADYFASCLRPTALRNIPFKPELPLEKRFVFENIAFEKTTRIIFQARSAFWRNDGGGINLTFNHPSLRTIWQVADEVQTDRVSLMAKAPGGTNPMRTLEAFKEFYPGNKSNITIEQTLVKDWSAGPFTAGCERVGYSALGSLSQFWPHVITPHGKIHFAGGHADNRSWGMEAATNSANRVAQEINNA